MFLNLGIFVNVALVMMGLFWCRVMFGRWRRDLDEFRSSDDSAARRAIVLLWAATALIVILMVDLFVGILENVGLL